MKQWLNHGLLSLIAKDQVSRQVSKRSVGMYLALKMVICSFLKLISSLQLVLWKVYFKEIDLIDIIK